MKFEHRLENYLSQHVLRKHRTKPDDLTAKQFRRLRKKLFSQRAKSESK